MEAGTNVRARVSWRNIAISLIDRVLSESNQFCYGRIIKLPIPNTSIEIKKGHPYAAPTVAILGRFSNAAVVEIGGHLLARGR